MIFIKGNGQMVFRTTTAGFCLKKASFFRGFGKKASFLEKDL